MNPTTGRFMTMDSYGGSLYDPMSLHKYLYANSNPINYIDPSGYINYRTQGRILWDGIAEKATEFSNYVFKENIEFWSSPLENIGKASKYWKEDLDYIWNSTISGNADWGYVGKAMCKDILQSFYESKKNLAINAYRLMPWTEISDEDARKAGHYVFDTTINVSTQIISAYAGAKTFEWAKGVEKKISNGMSKKVAGNDTVTYRRVQGGQGDSLNQISQHRIVVNDDGTINVSDKKTNLNISIDNGEHSSYYNKTKRGGTGDIVEFDVPKWMDDFLKESAIPQSGYRSNPLNQGGTA